MRGALLAAAVLLAPAVQAAPIARPAQLTLAISFENGSAPLEVSAASTVQVDEAAGTIVVPSGPLLSLATPIEVPFTRVTAFGTASLFWRASQLGLAGGTLSLGGATAQTVPAEGPCPEGGGAFACVEGGGLGGNVRFTGSFSLGIRVAGGTAAAVPFPATAFPIFGGAGSQFFTPAGPSRALTGDGGPFTTRRAFGGAPGTPTRTRTGRIAGSSIQLVSPTYVLVLAGNTFFFSTLTIDFTDGRGLPAFVPEPGGALLLGMGLLGLGGLRRTRR